MRRLFLLSLVLTPLVARANAPDSQQAEMLRILTEIGECALYLKGSPELVFRRLLGPRPDGQDFMRPLPSPSPFIRRLLQSEEAYRLASVVTRLKYTPVEDAFPVRGFLDSEADLVTLIGLWADSLHTDSALADVLFFKKAAQEIEGYLTKYSSRHQESRYLTSHYHLIFRLIRRAGMRLYQNPKMDFNLIWEQAAKSVFDPLVRLSYEVKELPPEAIDAWVLALAFDLHQYKANKEKPYRDALIEVFARRGSSPEIREQILEIFEMFVQRNRRRNDHLILRMGGSPLRSYCLGLTASVPLSPFLRKQHPDDDALLKWEKSFAYLTGLEIDRAYPVEPGQSENYIGNVLREMRMLLEDTLAQKWEK